MITGSLNVLPLAASLSCVANGHMPGSGCCADPSPTACFVPGGASGSCYCDLACHAEGTCCDDIQLLNCLRKCPWRPMVEPKCSLALIIATNCAEAGKLNCVVNTASAHQELCNVTTPQGQCYCDANCMAPGISEDCCTDALPMVSRDGMYKVSTIIVQVNCLTSLMSPMSRRNI